METLRVLVDHPTSRTCLPDGKILHAEYFIALHSIPSNTATTRRDGNVFQLLVGNAAMIADFVIQGIRCRNISERFFFNAGLRPR